MNKIFKELPTEFKVRLVDFNEDYRKEVVDAFLDAGYFFGYTIDKDKYENALKGINYLTVRINKGIRLGSDMVLFENLEELPEIHAKDFMVGLKSERIKELLPKSPKQVDLEFVKAYIGDEFGAKELERFLHAMKWRK